MSTSHDEIQRVQSTIVRISHHIDAKRWEDLRSLYADQVQVDYSALDGKPTQRVPADDLIEGWKKNLGPVTTQHLLGPIDVTIEGTMANAECHVRASHRVKGMPHGDDWIVIGHYRFRLTTTGDAWAIDQMTLDVYQQDGNPKLLQEAASG